MHKSKEDLRKLLLSINHRGYPAYKDTRGKWSFGKYILSIDHVQGDPFASPSKLSIEVPGTCAAFPAEYFREYHRRIALQDMLLRLFSKALADVGQRSCGSGKSGMLSTSRCGQEILERSACKINPSNGSVVMRLEAGFPANGRTINSLALIKILFDYLPGVIESTLFYPKLDARRIQEVIYLADDQDYIRKQLPDLGLCAFIADGAVLPRESGISQRPMKDAVPFTSPDSCAVILQLPHKGELRGMGIRKGITLVVGGGYHGKSTLLQALERGVYNHIRGDGREYVITDETAAKIRAEDGRSITNTDISLFINDLPNKKDTRRFSTSDASGSTSQAANVVEAIEAGTALLLIDEDTSATNFMVRDALMQRVVSPEKEPITPFISRIRSLYEEGGISTILVAGSSGSFFYVADTVIQMDHYVPVDITVQAKSAAAEYVKATISAQTAAIAPDHARNTSPTETETALMEHAGAANPTETEATVTERATATSPTKARVATVENNFSDKDDAKNVVSPNFSSIAGHTRIPLADPGLKRDNRIKIKVLSAENFLLNHDEVILRGLEQIADREQTCALAYVLKYMELHIFDGKKSLTQAVKEMNDLLSAKGLDLLFDGGCPGTGLALPRPQEIFGTINRYRKLRMER